MENPIKELSKNGTSYAKMGEITGIHYNTFYNLVKHGHKHIPYMTVGTYLKIKDKLKVDLIEYYLSNK